MGADIYATLPVSKRAPAYVLEAAVLSPQRVRVEVLVHVGLNMVVVQCTLFRNVARGFNLEKRSCLDRILEGLLKIYERQVYIG